MIDVSPEDDPGFRSIPVTEILVPPRVLSAMFVFSVVMAAICLLAAVAWLVSYQLSIFRESHAIMQDARTTYYPDFVLKTQMQALMIQSTPVSCGTLAGIGLGFLGFALFMVNVNLKPTMGIEGEYEKAKIKFVNMSPGLLVMLVAAILIGFCISRYHAFEPKVLEKWGQTEPDGEQSEPMRAQHTPSGEQ